MTPETPTPAPRSYAEQIRNAVSDLDWGGREREFHQFYDCLAALESERTTQAETIADRDEEIAFMRHDWAELGAILGLFPKGATVSFENFMGPEQVKPAVAQAMSKLAAVGEIARSRTKHPFPIECRQLAVDVLAALATGAATTGEANG